MPRADDSDVDVKREWYAFTVRLTKWLSKKKTYSFDDWDGYFDFEVEDGKTLMRLHAGQWRPGSAEVSLKIEDGQQRAPRKPSRRAKPDAPKRPPQAPEVPRLPRALGAVARGWDAVASRREESARAAAVESTAKWSAEHAQWVSRCAELDREDAARLEAWRTAAARTEADNARRSELLTEMGWAPSSGGFRRAVWKTDEVPLDAVDLKAVVELILRTLLDVLEVRRPNELRTVGPLDPGL